MTLLLCANGCPRPACHQSGVCLRCYSRLISKRHETGDKSRRHASALQPVEFIPRDRVDRETCLETLQERGLAWNEEAGVITWRER